MNNGLSVSTPSPTLQFIERIRGIEVGPFLLKYGKWALLAIGIFILIATVRRVWKKPHLWRRIEDRPETTFSYLRKTVSLHGIEYWVVLAFLLIGFSLEWHSLTILALWGFLITTLGAFYAARADYSSSQALVEAKGTYNAVVQFAESLEMFNDKVRYELKEFVKREEHISIKFLTVIPAFGAVGLEETYLKKQRHNTTYDTFPEWLCRLVGDQLHQRRNWNIEILTHEQTQAKVWLANIYKTAVDNGDLECKVNEKYAEQKAFVGKFAKELILPSNRRMRFWKPEKLKSENEEVNTEHQRIPFQFLLVKRFTSFKEEDSKPKELYDLQEPDDDLMRLFFLFSGDFLYDFVFKIFQQKIPMDELQKLTKGYYTEEKKLLKIFSNIFWNFSKNMPQLDESNSAEFYP